MWQEIWNNIVNYIITSFGLDRLHTPQGILLFICMSLNMLCVIFVLYRGLFMIIGTFCKKTVYPVAPSQDKKYAFIISARNEEKVISNLVASIREQDYPQDKITIFLIADNCSEGDKTAEIARELGCIVYERHDLSAQRKGYALDLLFQYIERDYGIMSFDGYVLCDADNILARDFLSKMHDALCSGKAKVFTGYCASKNFGDDFIASAHSISSYRVTLVSHRPRAKFGKGTNMGGKGTLFASEVLKDGWHYHELCEDWEFVLTKTINNEKILFVEEAVYYDEQPKTFKISWRQRLRWTKGVLINWVKFMPRYLKSFFKKPTWEKYDIWWDIFPYGLITTILFLIYNIVSLIFFFMGDTSYTWWSFASYIINTIGGLYVGNFLQGLLVLVRERKNIHCSVLKQALFLFTWPFFDLFNIPVSIASLFMRVKWKSIPHESQAKLEDFENDKKPKEEKSE